jgi:hypothetical protein
VNDPAKTDDPKEEPNNWAIPTKRCSVTGSHSVPVFVSGGGLLRLFHKRGIAPAPYVHAVGHQRHPRRCGNVARGVLWQRGKQRRLAG